MNAIPTKYGGVQFRSRLEARWAAFFDIWQVPWHYEPFDLAGYIPDFLIEVREDLCANPSQGWELVEIKPFLDDEPIEAEEKIDRSGWTGQANIYGLSPDHARLRLDPGDWVPVPCTAVVLDGRYELYDFAESMRSSWREAGNRVQWKAPR